jgi:phage terminase small subunit
LPKGILALKSTTMTSKKAAPKRKKPLPEFTKRNEAFITEYLIDMNGTQAAIRAGYSEKSAETQASRLLRNDKVKRKIKELQDKRAEKVGITAERVLQELALIGFSNIQDYLDDKNHIGELTKLDEVKAKAIGSVKVSVIETKQGTYTETQFKLHDKLSALEKIAKHIGFFQRDNEQKGADVEQVFKVLGQNFKF